MPDYGYDELLQYYIYPNGQCQESCRDQGHAVGGLHNYVAIAEMTWNQGDSLYSCLNNRILLGLEWNYRYNLSKLRTYNDQFVPWEPTGFTRNIEEASYENGKFLRLHSRSGRWESIDVSDIGRGDPAGTSGAREMALAHYSVRAGLSLEKYTWLQRYRDYMIEQYGHENWGVAPNWFYEWTGWGTLSKRLTPWMAGDPVSFASGKRVSGIHVCQRSFPRQIMTIIAQQKIPKGIHATIQAQCAVMRIARTVPLNWLRIKKAISLRKPKMVNG